MGNTRWGIIFLQTDARLTLEQREYLLAEATEMYFQAESQRDVKIKSRKHSLEGRIKSSGEIGFLGSFQGIKFSAEIDLETGPAYLAFLVSEQTRKVYETSRRGAEEYTN